MKRQQQTTYHKKNKTYIEGNAVRRLDAVPQERRREKQKPRVSHATRKNREKAMQMDFGYVMFLTLVTIVTVCVCMTYVNIQSEIENRLNKISTLESSIMNLKTENDAEWSRLETSVDYEAIKNKAINELGMVYPNEEQIKFYEPKMNDYMNQYEDIPEK